MLHLAERCYWKIQIIQYNGRKCNCRHKTSVPAGQFDRKMGIFLMTHLSLNMWSCLLEKRTKQGHFLFAPTLCFINIFFQSRWLGGFCSMKKCIPSSCMCRASVYESDFLNLFSPNPPLLSSWGAEALSAGCRSWGCLAEWGSSHEPECGFGRAVVSPWAPPEQGWPGHCSPLTPLWGHSFKSYKQTEMYSQWNCCNNWTLEWLVQIPWWPKLLFLCIASTSENTEQLDSCRQSDTRKISRNQTKCHLQKSESVGECSQIQSWELGIILKYFICVLEPVNNYYNSRSAWPALAHGWDLKDNAAAFIFQARL